MSDDKIQREIEDILTRLDTFLPDERKPIRFRRRSSFSPGGLFRSVIEPVARISLRQVMLTALILIIVGFFGIRVYPVFGRWVLIAGVILLLTSFALSFFSRGGPAAQTDKRWRGRPMELGEPSLADRLRSWLQGKRRAR